MLTTFGDYFRPHEVHLGLVSVLVHRDVEPVHRLVSVQSELGCSSHDSVV